VTQYHVTLNGQGYLLDLGRYSRRVRDPFVTKQSSGSVAVGDLRGPEQVFVISEWSGGEGFQQHDEANPGRYRSGAGIDVYTDPKSVRIGVNPTGTILAGFDAYRPLAVYKGKLYVGTTGTAVQTWDGAAVATPFNLPANQATCAAVYMDILYLGNATDGKLSSWDNAALTNQAALAGGPIHTLAVHYRQAAQYLYVGADGAGVNGIGRAYYYDGVNLSAGQYDFEEARPYAAAVLNGRLYWVASDPTERRWGIYSVDDAAGGGVWRSHVRVDGGYAVSAVTYDGLIYIGDGTAGRIWAWDGTRLRVVLELTVPGANYTTELLGMVVWRGALWVAVVVAAGFDLLRYDGTAWSRPGTGLASASATPERIVAYSEQLYVGTRKAAAAGICQPVHRLLHGPSGIVESGLIHCGLPGVSKLFRSVTIVTSALANPQSVKVEYRLEDTGGWTTLGTFSTVGGTTATYSFAANTTGRQIAFRVTLSGTAGTTSSPILYELSLRYAPRPAVTREWDLPVILEGTAELPLVTLDGTPDPSTGAQLTSALWTAAGSAGPVTLVDLDGVTYTVYVDDIREEVAKLSQRKGYQRVGLVRLVEAA
jgi:hypothetical protein